MFAVKSLIAKIFKLHFRTFKLAYNGYDKS